MAIIKNLISHPFLISLIAAGLFFIAVYLAGPTLLECFLVVKSPVKRVDALVLMAGARKHRLPAIVELYHKGVAQQILLTNDGVKGPYSFKDQRNLFLVEWAREYLLQSGIPKDRIVLLDFTQSGSYFDALNTKAYIRKHGDIDSLLVVTSHYHTRRTLWSFNKVFKEMKVQIGVYPVPKDNNSRGRLFKTMTVELIKLLYYQVRYGLLDDKTLN